MRGFAVVFILLIGATDPVAAETCATCASSKAAELKTGNDSAAKCTGFKEYIKCLDSTAKDSDDCPLEQSVATVIGSFDETTTCATNKLTATCLCQKTFWGNGGGCTAIADLKTCTEKITSGVKGCDGTTSASDILTQAKARLNCATTAVEAPSSTYSTTLSTTTENSKATTTVGTPFSTYSVHVSENNGLIATLVMSLLGLFFM